MSQGRREMHVLEAGCADGPAAAASAPDLNTDVVAGAIAVSHGARAATDDQAAAAAAFTVGAAIAHAPGEAFDIDAVVVAVDINVVECPRVSLDDDAAAAARAGVGTRRLAHTP